MLELTGTAFINTDNKVTVLFVAQNIGDTKIRLGSNTSEYYSFHASSETESHYGDSVGHMMAGHHLDLPQNKSLVISREYEDEPYTLEDGEKLFEPLNASVSESVTVTFELYEKNGTTHRSELTFTPSSLQMRPASGVATELRTYPETENTLQLG